MANQKKRRHARYDRLAGVGMFVLCVVLLIILITRCTKKQPEEPVSSTAVNVTISSETVSVQERKNYAQASVPTEKVHSGHMILVNQAFPCQIDSEAVLNGSSSEIQFVTIKSILDTKTEEVKPYTAADWEVGLDNVVALAMDSWFEAFCKKTGHRDLRMIGGYKPNAEDPDFQTGRTLTIGIFPETGTSSVYTPEGDYAWLSEHASEYGFILRYPEGKDAYFDKGITERRTATFRYVGLAPAAYIASRGMCLEEFLHEIRRYSVDNMLIIKSNGKSYGMYFVPAETENETTVFSVPSSETPYDISGNNSDGFIITVYQTP